MVVKLERVSVLYVVNLVKVEENKLFLLHTQFQESVILYHSDF